MIENMLEVVRGKGKRDSDGQRNFVFNSLAHDYRKDRKTTEGSKHYTHTFENAQGREIGKEKTYHSCAQNRRKRTRTKTHQ